VFHLQLVGPEDEAAVLAFEIGNRSYFTKSINDRGDAFFERYPERHRELMAEQEAGTGAFYISVDEHGAVVGRFNLCRISDGKAEIGYRVAEQVSGHGVATSGVRTLCQIAREDFGLSTLTAATSNENVASQHVLLRVGFAYVEPTEVAGRRGMLFDIDLLLSDGKTP
jgi:[ribosomal protein S5]-alanine N-acetyltransferase